jgi:NADH-quinone oxidoreductase subunit C
LGYVRGVFLNHSNLTRLLTDYGFQVIQERFSISGFTESRYNVIKNRVVYENIELAQEYRTFDFSRGTINTK